jgi:hypothetical protein
MSFESRLALVEQAAHYYLSRPKDRKHYPLISIRKFRHSLMNALHKSHYFQYADSENQKKLRHKLLGEIIKSSAEVPV